MRIEHAMNAAQLRELIAQGETAHVEFKSSFQKEVIETLTAFANNQGSMAVTVFKTPLKTKDSGVDGGLNVGVNGLLTYVKANLGQRAGEMAVTFAVTQRTIERWLKQLKAQSLVEFRGAPKTGGYHAT